MKTVEPILDLSTLIKTNKWFKNKLRKYGKLHKEKFYWGMLKTRDENGDFMLTAGSEKSLILKILYLEPKEFFKILNITPEQFYKLSEEKRIIIL